MDYRALGRTGLRVTTLGIGGGGPSRLGQRHGKPAAESVAVVRAALDLGVNFIDTAEAYGTEGIIGQAITGRDRSQLVISTKKRTWGDAITPESTVASLDASLRALGTDYIDIYHLHGVRASMYDQLRDEIVPVLQRQRDAGKIRFIGITEAWNSDPAHETLQRAVQDDVWDVMMVGFNLLNQSARERVLPHTIANNIGVLAMFAVRTALSQPDHLRRVIDELIAQGQIDPDGLDRDDPLGFVLADTDSLVDAAYRYCLHEPGIHVVLSGTGSTDHLRQNVASMAGPPLPAEVRERLRVLFAGVDSITGQ